ncbi:MAG: GYD domain-containing protein, partial [Acidimicrobiia bacterium]
MAKYLVIASYSPDGIKGVLKTGGTARSKAVGDAVKGVGGTMESFYFAFGDTDAYVVVDVPDNTAAAAVGLAVSSTGLASTRTVVLLTPSEIDAAAKQKVSYT